MSGELARRGFRFQDLYLLKRVLREAAESLPRADTQAEPAATLQRLRFGVEAKTVFAESSDSPAWDVVLIHDRLVWSTPTHGAVIAWSLERTSRYADVDRVKVFRLLLKRNDLEDAAALHHLWRE